MTSARAQARETADHAPASQQIDGLLVIDTVHIRAHYECYRPGCPKPREEPIRPSAVTAFIGGIKTRHMTQYHGEQR